MATGGVIVRDFFVATLCLLPIIIIASGSVFGNRTGIFVFCSWVISSVLGGIFGIYYFLYGVIVIVFVAVFFRRNLNLKEWFNSTLL
jgi:hypothetical protein